MNLTKCKNGHYYDADKYPNCPHCTGGVNTDDDVTVNMEQTGTGFGNSQGISQTVGFWEPSQSQSSPSPSSVTLGPGNGPVSLMQAVNAAAAVPVNVQQEADEDKTVSYYGGTLETEPVVGWLVCIEGKQLGKAFE